MRFCQVDILDQYTIAEVQNKSSTKRDYFFHTQNINTYDLCLTKLYMRYLQSQSNDMLHNKNCLKHV